MHSFTGVQNENFSRGLDYGLIRGRVLFISRSGTFKSTLVSEYEYTLGHYFQVVCWRPPEVVLADLAKTSLIVYFESRTKPGARSVIDALGVPVIRVSSVPNAKPLPLEVVYGHAPTDKLLWNSTQFVLEELTKRLRLMKKTPPKPNPKALVMWYWTQLHFEESEDRPLYRTTRAVKGRPYGKAKA